MTTLPQLSPLALGLPALQKLPHLGCSLTAQDFWSPEKRSLVLNLCMALAPTTPYGSRLTSKPCRTLGRVTALQGSMTFPATIMTPEHFSGVWERLREFISQMWIIFTDYPEGICFRFQLLRENNFLGQWVNGMWMDALMRLLRAT